MVDVKGNEFARECDLSECYFSRGPSGMDGFDSIVMRVPISNDRSGEVVTELGEVGRDMIVKYHLASTCGILRAAGFYSVALDVEQSAKAIVGVLGDVKDGDEQVR